MLKEMMRAYKIVGYGLSIKKQMAFAVGFAVLGLVFEIITSGANIIGSFYIILSGMFIYQLIISVDVSTLVQSSPFKKKIQCTYPVLATAPFLYITLTILTIVHWVFAKTGSADVYATQCQMIFVLGSLLFVVMIYFGVTYKYFIVSTVLMCLSISFSMGIVQALARTVSLTFAGSVIYAYVMITLGTFIAWILANALYKKPLSKMAFRGMIKAD